MAYQNVGTPRFYIDYSQYLLAIGDPLYGNIHEYQQGGISGLRRRHTMSLNPTYAVRRSMANVPPIKRIAPIRYAAYLGHNRGLSYPIWADEAGTGVVGAYMYNGFSGYGGVNTQTPSYTYYPDYSGFSIFLFDDKPDQDYLKTDYSTKADMGTLAGTGVEAWI